MIRASNTVANVEPDAIRRRAGAAGRLARMKAKTAGSSLLDQAHHLTHKGVDQAHLAHDGGFMEGLLDEVRRRARTTHNNTRLDTTTAHTQRRARARL